MATYSAGFLELVWNRVDSQGTTEFMPIVDVFLVDPI